ncbi:hypothetical protein STEG23_012996 [Scotinomys teguina]
MQPGRTTNTGGGAMEVKATALRCQLLLILLMSAVMLLPGTNGSLLLAQRRVTRTVVLQETIGKVGIVGYGLHKMTVFLENVYLQKQDPDPVPTYLIFLSPYPNCAVIKAFQVLGLKFVSVVDYVFSFAYVEIFLILWNKGNLIMLDYFIHLLYSGIIPYFTGAFNSVTNLLNFGLKYILSDIKWTHLLAFGVAFLEITFSILLRL